MVSGLAHNLLSVGQLLIKGYSVIFHEDKCIITDNFTGESMIEIPRTSNSMFLVNLSKTERLNLAVNKHLVPKLCIQGLCI